MDYLKLFQTHEEYEAFVSGGTMVRPNVSHCVSENDVHYNAISQEETKLVIKYNVTDTSNPTKLLNRFTGTFESVTIDDVEVRILDLENAQWYYQLSMGEHIVKFEISNNTTLDEHMFFECSAISEAYIPKNVTTIGNSVFEETNLTKATVAENITYLGDSVFCSNAQHIDVYIYAVIPPTMEATFCTNATVYVPAESVNAYIEVADPSYADYFRPIPTT